MEWDDSGAERRSSEELLAEHVRLVESGEKAVVARDDGDVDKALADAASTVDAIYSLPYLAHAPMEPNNAACRMREDGVLEVWAATETPEYVKMNASAVAGIDKEEVEVHVTLAGGSFGLHSSAERDPVTEVIEHPDPMAMCRCGHSSNKPFCDGTHATIDFDGTLAN